MASSRNAIRLLVFDASLRKDSHNRRLAQLGLRCSEKTGATVDRATLADCDCPSYNHNVETGPGIPAGADKLCRALKAADAFSVYPALPGPEKAVGRVSRRAPRPRH